MNIQTVAQNLRKTIARKEMLLATYENKEIKVYTEEVRSAIVTQLILNIAELHDILADVEVCCQQHNEMGWQINPERMGQ